jgi:hypothetical protein
MSPALEGHTSIMHAYYLQDIRICVQKLTLSHQRSP